MRFGRIWLLQLACCIGLATVAHAQAQFDGVYRGDPTSGTGCSLLHPTLRVTGGTATMQYNPQINFEGKVEPNGTLDVVSGKARLSGKFAEGRFQGSVDGGRTCRYDILLKR